MVTVNGNDILIGDKSVREILKAAAEEAAKRFGTAPLYMELKKTQGGQFYIAPEDALYSRTDRFGNHEKAMAVSGSFATTIKALHDACKTAGIDPAEEIKSSTYRPNRQGNKTIYEARWGIVFNSLNVQQGGSTQTDVRGQLAALTQKYFALGGEAPSEAILSNDSVALGWIKNQILALEAEQAEEVEDSIDDDGEPAF